MPNVSVSLFRRTATQQSNIEPFYLCSIFQLDFQESTAISHCLGSAGRNSFWSPGRSRESLTHPGTRGQTCIPWGGDLRSPVLAPREPPWELTTVTSDATGSAGTSLQW